MAAIGALEQVALPQQPVGMHVGDVERRLQSLRGGRDAELNRHDPVQRLLDLGRHDREEADSHHDQRDGDHLQTGQKPFLHGYVPLPLSNAGPRLNRRRHRKYGLPRFPGTSPDGHKRVNSTPLPFLNRPETLS